jgi:hypothetical protein
VSNKKIILWFLAGWLLALVIPPTRITAMFKGSGK